MPAFAQEADDQSFGLGQIIVTAPRADGVAIDASTLSSEAMVTFNRQSLDDALAIMPGVTAGNSGGSRNERLIFVRGFDRFQVPLSIDGIRMYLPADNRLDFGRFLTADIAQVQVAKGYASVLDGPGAMGGAINLVTRKPTKELEAEVGGTLNGDRTADYAGYNVFALLGTKQDQWYAQASFTRNFRDHWDLPADFNPTVNEDGGARDLSRTADWRANVKVGFTPNATDEYSLSYTRQEGEKNAPLHLTSTVNNVRRFWNWPEWNISSIYFLSTTALDDRATLKTRVYYNKFCNMLRSFNDKEQTIQNTARAFDSPYDDNAQGGSAQLDFAASEADMLSIAFHYRRDEHNERQISAPDLASSSYEPNQRTVERTWSVALENKLDLSEQLKLTLGGSYDWRNLDRAEEYDSTARAIFSFPLRDADGWNAQGRLDWEGGDGTSAYASVSSRIRFPTLFERFSSQFGTAEPNPELKPERATNFEIGADKKFGPFHASAAIYYSRLSDALVSVRTSANLNRRENIGSADYYGGEITLDAQLTPSLQAGVTYSYIHRDFDVGDAPIGGFIRLFRLTDVPSHKGFGWVSWRPVERLNIAPSVELASNRTTATAATASNDVPGYYRTGAYVNAAIRIDYDILPQVTVGVGARNLFDDYYILTDGFPEQGRSFFASLRARY